MKTSGNAYLILGLGELGDAVLRGLTERDPGCGITVLVRPETFTSPSPEKRNALERLEALGVRFVAADLANDSAATLAEVFTPFDTVIGCTGFASGAPIQRKLCEAILEVGVVRYVPWQFGVDYDLIGRGSAQDLFDEQLDVRELLRAQDKTEWVIISTGMFTSFLFEPALGVVDLENSIVHALGSLDTAITVTTAKDIGRLTAEILITEPKIQNTVVYTAGDTITYRQFADILEGTLGRAFQREERSVTELQQALAQAPHDAMRKYRVVFAEGKGVSWDKRRTFNGQRGLNVTSVEQWARGNSNSVHKTTRVRDGRQVEMEQNRQIVEEAFDRWSKGHGSILDLMGDDGLVVIPGIAAHCGMASKREFVTNVATPFMNRFSRLPVPRPSKIMADGNDVIVVADAEGTTLEGKAYRNDYVFVLEFSNSRLVKATEFLDMAAFNAVWDSVTPEEETEAHR